MNFATPGYTIKDTRTNTCQGTWAKTLGGREMAEMNVNLKNAAFKSQGLPECFELVIL